MFMLCSVVLSMMVVNIDGARFIDPGVLDPCKRTKNRPAHCSTGGPPVAANPYTRGCSAFQRCRSSPP